MLGYFLTPHWPPMGVPNKNAWSPSPQTKQKCNDGSAILSYLLLMNWHVNWMNNLRLMPIIWQQIHYVLLHLNKIISLFAVELMFVNNVQQTFRCFVRLGQIGIAAHSQLPVSQFFFLFVLFFLLALSENWPHLIVSVFDIQPTSRGPYFGAFQNPGLSLQCLWGFQLCLWYSGHQSAAAGMRPNARNSSHVAVVASKPLPFFCHWCGHMSAVSWDPLELSALCTSRGCAVFALQQHTAHAIWAYAVCTGPAIGWGPVCHLKLVEIRCTSWVFSYLYILWFVCLF